MRLQCIFAVYAVCICRLYPEYCCTLLPRVELLVMKVVLNEDEARVTEGYCSGQVENGVPTRGCPTHRDCFRKMTRSKDVNWLQLIPTHSALACAYLWSTLLIPI